MVEYRDESKFRKDIQFLISMISNYRPDIIVPLLRGGQAPCVYVAEEFQIMDVRPISVERRGEGRVIVYPNKGDIGDVKACNILLLEDDIVTGKSLLHAKEFYENKGASVKIAAVYVNTNTKSMADFYGRVSNPLPNLYFKPSRSGDRIVN